MYIERYRNSICWLWSTRKKDKRYWENKRKKVFSDLILKFAEGSDFWKISGILYMIDTLRDMIYLNGDINSKETHSHIPFISLCYLKEIFIHCPTHCNNFYSKKAK